MFPSKYFHGGRRGLRPGSFGFPGSGANYEIRERKARRIPRKVKSSGAVRIPRASAKNGASPRWRRSSAFALFRRREARRRAAPASDRLRRDPLRNGSFQPCCCRGVPAVGWKMEFREVAPYRPRDCGASWRVRERSLHREKRRPHRRSPASARFRSPPRCREAETVPPGQGRWPPDRRRGSRRPPG